jgi:uncharacterized protein (DUF2267 family)
MASAPDDPRDLLTSVARAAGIDRDRAERATRAVLHTLAERLSVGEARDLAERLPAPLSGWLYTTTGPEPFRYDEFLRRVAEREGTDVGTAARDARAVFWALGETVGRDEIEDLAAELPHDFAEVVAEARGRHGSAVDADAFIAEVAARAQVSPEVARRVADAVLETLAERISGGEADDLEAVLPTALRAPLERGKARSREARRLSLDEFLERVGRRLGVPPLLARRHVEAVFGALRESLPDEEWLDVLAELPRDYAAVGARPRST